VPPTPGAPDAAPPVDNPDPPDAAPPGAPDGGVPTGLTVADCFADAFETPPDLGPDYDQYGPTVGEHCLGTNHQAISGIERVVFLGDSVTVGSPPTPDAEFYRSRLADQLAARYGLTPPDLLWKGVNIFDGRTWMQDSGDFASCAKWGARADDLLRDNTQIEDCFPPEQREKRTLVVITVGGNDISNITQDGIDGVPIPDIWQDVEEFVQLVREAIEWFHETPDKFPNGVYVVFGNMFEFTDATGDVTACPAAGLAGFGAEWDDPDALADMVIWANEQFLKIAVDTRTDMIFNLEHFCGHGFNHDNPASPCYRGPSSERWFDDTCIHPNPTGHGQLADMFMAVVDE
jgi:lysophospholipase L1-like esterase